MKDTLAIVIPAYKARFFGLTLNSIASQTCHEFHVYIGDDASPEDLASIVRQYESRFPITYFRFEENVGSTDLTRHWMRCIELAYEHDWIWLFSDDDMMSCNAIEEFYKHQRNNEAAEIFRYSVQIIDANENVIKESHDTDDVLTSHRFILNKWRGKLNSFAVEYAFRASKFREVGGFEKFDLAWNSDDATWIKMGRPGGIAKIQTAHVRWRSSDINISRDNSLPICLRKISSNLAFMRFSCNYFAYLPFAWQILLHIWMLAWFLANLKVYSKANKSLKSQEFIRIATGISLHKLLFPLAWCYYSLKRVK